MGITQVHLERRQAITGVVVVLAQTAQKGPIIRLIIFVRPHRRFRAIILVMDDREVTIHTLPKIVCPSNLKVAQAIQVL